jgi:hypothetical protein
MLVSYRMQMADQIWSLNMLVREKLQFSLFLKTVHFGLGF